MGRSRATVVVATVALAALVLGGCRLIDPGDRPTTPADAARVAEVTGRWRQGLAGTWTYRARLSCFCPQRFWLVVARDGAVIVTLRYDRGPDGWVGPVRDDNPSASPLAVLGGAASDITSGGTVGINETGDVRDGIVVDSDPLPAAIDDESTWIFDGFEHRS